MANSDLNGDDRITIFLVLLIVLVFTIHIAVFSVGGYFLLRWANRHLQFDKVIWGIIAVTAGAVPFLSSASPAGDYGAWIKQFPLQTLNPIPDPPYILAMPLFWAAAAMMLSGTPTGNRLNEAMYKKLGRSGWQEEETPEEALLSHLDDSPIVGIPGQATSVEVHQDPDKLVIGKTAYGAEAYVTKSELNKHGVITGMTGSGKTTTITTLAGAALDAGYDVLVIDMKEDLEGPKNPQDPNDQGGLRWWLRTYGQAHGVPYRQITLSDPTPAEHWFNPIHGLSMDQAAQAIAGVQEWDDAFWQNLSRSIIGQVVDLYFRTWHAYPDKYQEPTIVEIGKLLKLGAGLIPVVKPRLLDAVELMPNETAEDKEARSLAYDKLRKMDKKDEENAAGLGQRLVNMYETEAGRRVLQNGPGKQILEIEDKGITYVGLSTSGTADLAVMVSTALMVRLGALAAQIISGSPELRRPRLIIIDEANFVDRHWLHNILSRVRSAGMSVIVATQSALDWEEDWDKVTGNTNLKFFMLQGNHRSAVLCSDEFGSYTATSKTTSFSPAGEERVSFSETDKVNVNPDEFEKLPAGTGLMKLQTRKASDRVSGVRINMRHPRD